MTFTGCENIATNGFMWQRQKTMKKFYKTRRHMKHSLKNGPSWHNASYVKQFMKISGYEENCEW